MVEPLTRCRLIRIGTIFIAFLLIAGGLFVCPTGASEKFRVPNSLVRALEATGVMEREARRFLNPSVVSVNIPIILKNLTHRERKEDYRAFLEEEQIERSRRFLHRHLAVLSGIERAYGVPKEVIVAILLVESDLGQQHDRHSVLEVYTSLAALIDPQVHATVIREADKAGLQPRTPAFRHRMNRKAAWGLRQLSCLIRIGRKRVVDITKLKGSWAGAFGMPQFIPTSFEEYGVDWNKDGVIRLDLLPDAAASAANYLQREGWKGEMTRKKALAVIKRYNHSQPYAETILAIAKKLGE